MRIRRRDSPGRASGRQVIAPETFPALSAFFGGYLHQDLVPVHGSAGAAAQAFVQDAGDDARDAVRQELIRLIALVRGRNHGVLRRAMRSLGAAWSPSSVAEVEALLEQLGGTVPARPGRGEG